MSKWKDIGKWNYNHWTKTSLVISYSNKGLVLAFSVHLSFTMCSRHKGTLTSVISRFSCTWGQNVTCPNRCNWGQLISIKINDQFQISAFKIHFKVYFYLLLFGPQDCQPTLSEPHLLNISWLCFGNLAQENWGRNKPGRFQ